MKYPKIYLAIDNCFAYKRWTQPDAWARVIKDLGVYYIEASADTELDPLIMGKEYLTRWVDDVKEAEAKYSVKVSNLYSGHGTYFTLGLAHTHEAVRRRMIDEWFKPLINTAADLDAGIGFFAHAFSDYVLQDKKIYADYLEILYAGLSELNSYGEEVGCGHLSLEQMYSPHQVPWRIEGTKKLLREVTQRSDRNFYFTEDLGHHHTKFIKPTEKAIKLAMDSYAKTGDMGELWLGSNHAYDLFNEAVTGPNNLSQSAVKTIIKDIDNHHHLFSKKEDSDCYEWLRQLGCYSPIIHLQQSNGLSSSHGHFTEKNNKDGIIDGKKILTAIKESYDRHQEKGMPNKTGAIYLTLEAFAATASINSLTLKDYAQSVDYWRRFVPQDGLYLDDLL